MKSRWQGQATRVEFERFPLRSHHQIYNIKFLKPISSFSSNFPMVHLTIGFNCTCFHISILIQLIDHSKYLRWLSDVFRSDLQLLQLSLCSVASLVQRSVTLILSPISRQKVVQTSSVKSDVPIIAPCDEMVEDSLNTGQVGYTDMEESCAVKVFKVFFEVSLYFINRDIHVPW